MAVTKTHPIKSTLKAAIDYILNPEKTDGKLLASSFGCGLETADIEFAWTREAAGDRGTHLGRHLIQSFAVGETTPEEAHKIGIHRYSTFPASTSFIIAKNPGRSKQVPLMPSSVKWTMFVNPCRAANSSNIAF